MTSRARDARLRISVPGFTTARALRVVRLGLLEVAHAHPRPPGGDPKKSAFEWDEQRGINPAGGLGLGLFLTNCLIIAPEVRIGLLPVLR